MKLRQPFETEPVPIPEGNTPEDESHTNDAFIFA